MKRSPRVLMRPVLGAILATLVGVIFASCTPDLRPQTTNARRQAARRAGAWIHDPFAAWPQLMPGTEARSFSSFDREGGNADGFQGIFSTLYQLPSGEHVIFDALGPGVLRTLWFTGPEEGGEGLDLGLIRFYFDDERRARLALTLRQLFCGKGPRPFRPPLVSHNAQSSGAFVSWVPLPFAKRLIITTKREPGFYAAYYDRLPTATRIKEFNPREISKSSLRLARHLRQRRLGPRPRNWQRITSPYRYRGQGTIEGIRFSPHGALLPEHLSRGRIRITWDDATHPAVDAPLGLFFGSGLGEAHINALAFSMRPGGPYENRIPMPFWRGFKIAVDGVKGTIEIAIGPKRFLRRNAGSLHARAFTAAHPRRGEDIVILDVTGEGKLIGTVLAVHPSPHVKRWWEGDLHSYVDGRRTPGIHGTGVEDDHLAGWSNTLFAHPFSLPLHGEPQSHIIEANGLQHNAEISLYRLWPGIPFSQHLRHSFEHGNENTVDARYRGLAFFYLRQPQRPALVEADRLVLANAASRRAHDLHVAGTKTLIRMKSSFEGEDADWPFSAQTLVHRGSATFTFHLPPKNRGCWLRRLYDQEQGRQRARLLVDGHYLRDWYIAEGNATCAWAERGLFLPASITAGRKAITLTLEPRPDAPPWNAAIYRILCLRDVDDS